jgi:hypothetical protein
MPLTDHRWWMIFSHDWTPTAVYTRDEPFIDDEGDPITIVDEHDHGRTATRPRTDVLYVCTCNKARTKTLQGKWTLDQVKGG